MKTVIDILDTMTDLAYEFGDSNAFKTMAAIVIFGAIPAAAFFAFF